jgi:hypothetical protein
MNAVVNHAASPIRLDIGCGPNKKPDWLGVDAIAFPGVDVVHDLRSGVWPWEDSSVAESQASHFIEHLTNFNDKWERVHFFNELWRITVPDGKCTLIFPHWASNRFYGDPTHKEPISEMSFYYLDPVWRAANAPHTDIKHNPNGYNCHWACSWGYYLHPSLGVRNAEYQEFAKQFFKEACSDMVVTMQAIKK